MQFSLGQRWFSDTESDLGLGTVIDINGRQVTMMFPATGETRVYAINTAPLTRLALQVGDNVRSHQGWEMQITEIDQTDGQISYTGVRQDTQEKELLRETFVDHQMQLSKPQQRLFAGQFDKPAWFALRHRCLQQQFDHQTSPLLGLVGARVDLIPHQLHIAQTVGQRYAPRVLLADEVGLGKTIEAALTIHQQVLSGRASRVLIIVPDSLVHQWLVEMLRRVNLAFSIFDAERCQAMAESDGNPFDSEQLVLCSLDFLAHHHEYFDLVKQSHWDLLVVDEAHHLRWSPNQPSEQYNMIAQLAEQTPGVLLLTATPDQLGHESHFARLRLLDPDRFHDYPSFVKEESHYAELAQAIQPLLSGEKLDDLARAAIEPYVSREPELLEHIDQPGAKDQLIRHLLDCHGTGRLLFRNSRAGIEGFPKRELHSYALPFPSVYQQDLSEPSIDLLLCPERQASVNQNWLKFDPRLDWLMDKLEHLKGQKVLCICAHASTALQLNEHLRMRTAIRGSVFHEGMSIVERDKAATYFAQEEDGAQILICSEIGSEGRNFQFAHHLVLFDLPAVPDLLEQRIGRLDRIGQKHDVQIHVPYFEKSAQQVMLNWYHQGLQAFEHTCPTGHAVFEQVREQLIDCLFSPEDASLSEQLLRETQLLHQQMREKLEQGRDKLLELNSSGQGQADTVIKRIRAHDDTQRIAHYATELFNAIGVNQEERDQNSFVITPGESMLSQFPGLHEEGMTITYDRQTALHFEHVHFLSADHPMIQHATDMVLTDVIGKSSLALQKDKALPVGYFWLECLFVVSCSAPKQLQPQRFLPATPVRICINANGEPDDEIQFAALRRVKQQTGKQLIGALLPHIEKALSRAEQEALLATDEVKTHAQSNMQRLLGDELQRLRSLQRVNPSIRDIEIEHLQHQIQQLEHAIAEAKFELDAIRLIVNNH